MTEKEKMLRGERYFASDPVLVAERLRAEKLMQEYAFTPPNDKAKLAEVLARLLPNAQKDASISQPFYCDYGYNIFIGKHFYANKGCVMLDVMPIHISNDVKLGPMVQLYTATHPLNPEERATQAEFAKPVSLGDKVWIGGGSIICPGVSIGEGAVIGAGSVVTKDVPARVLAAGNPCRIIRPL